MEKTTLTSSISRFTLIPLAFLLIALPAAPSSALEAGGQNTPDQSAPPAQTEPKSPQREAPFVPLNPPGNRFGGAPGLKSERFLSVQSEKLTPEAHAKALKDLYEQLEAATDKELAQVIERAIERLWMKSGSETIDLLMARAIGAVQMKDYELALGLLDRVTAIAPNYPEAWNKRAWVHFQKEDYLSSMDDLRQVLSRDPRHFKAIHGLSMVFRQLGVKRAALKAIRKALTLHPFLEEAQAAEKMLSRDVEGEGI